MRHYIRYILHTIALAFFLVTIKRMMVLGLSFNVLLNDPSLLFASVQRIRSVIGP